MQVTARCASYWCVITLVLNCLVGDVGICVVNPIVRQQSTRSDNRRQVIDVGNVIQPNGIGNRHLINTAG